MTTSPIAQPFYPYHAHFAKEMGLIGVATIAASVLYFVASNWFWWSPSWRIALMIGLFVITAIIGALPAIYAKPLVRQSLDTISVVLIGLTLAIIGQTYQTGADSFWLFTLWAVLALPWLYRHNTGVYFLWCVVSQLALWLFFRQNFANDVPMAYLFIAHMLAIIQLIIANKIYPKARLLSVVILSLLSFMSANVTSHYYATFLDKIIAFGLMVGVPLMVSYHLRRQGQQMATALMLTGLGVSASVFLMIHWGFGGIEDLFVLGAIILAWFFALGRMMMNFFPKGSFHHIPSTLGAWLSGLIFAVATLGFWGSFSMVLGFMSFVLALWLLKANHRHFVQQLAYCLMLAGQLAFLVHLGDKTDSMLAVWLAQAVIMAAVLFLRLPWLVIFYHAFMLYALSCMYFAYMADWLTDTPSLGMIDGISWLFLTPLILLNAKHPSVHFYARAILLITPCVIATTLAQKATALDSLAITTFKPSFAWTNGVWLLLFLLAYHYHNNHVKHTALFGTLGVVLLMMGYFELFVLLLGLLWANTHSAKIMQGLYLTSIGLYLWQIYYSLEMSFLLKSGTMMASGLVFLMMAFYLQQKTRITP